MAYRDALLRRAETPEKPDTVQTMTDLFQNVGLPIAGIVESVVSRGKSPGTTAMNQQRVFADAREANRLRQEAEYRRALEEKALGVKDDEAKRKQGQYDLEAKEAERKYIKKAIYEKAVREAGTDEEKRKIVLDYLAEEAPEKYASLTKPNEPNQIEQLIAGLKLQSLQNTVQQQTSPRLSANTIETLTDLQNFPQKLNLLKEGIKTNPDIMGPVVGRFSNVKGAMGLTDESTLRAQGLQQKYEAVKQIVAKAMEGGVLRKEDMPKYEKILGSILISPQAAEQNIAQLESMLAQDYNNKISSFKQQGYNVSGFSPINVEQKPAAGGFKIIKVE